jgi:hypothetical protein
MAQVLRHLLDVDAVGQRDARSSGFSHGSVYGLFERQDDVATTAYRYQTVPHTAFPLYQPPRNAGPA